MATAMAEPQGSSPELGRGSGRTTLWTKLTYGFGSVAFGIKDNGFAYFLLLYYNQVLGLPTTLAGKAIAIALVIDAFADPLIGHLSDNLHSRWGRRHPFMYASIVPVAIAYYLLWNPPASILNPPGGFSPERLFYYLIALAILVRTFITMYEIPSSALVAELTHNYDERTSMLGYRYFFGWWGGLGMALLANFVLLQPTAQYPTGQLNPLAWQKYGLIASVVMALSVLASCVGTNRHIPFLRQPPPKRPFSPGRSIKELFESLSNRSFAVLFISAIFGAAAAGISTSLNIYFTTYFWELKPTQVGLITFGPLLSSSVALFLAPLLSRRIGKKRAAMLITFGSIVFAPVPVVGRLIGLMPPNGSSWIVPILVVHTVIEVTLIVCSGILIASMVTDTVEESELATGRRSEGVFFGARTFLAKAVNGFGVYGATVLLGLVGFPNDAKPGLVDPAVIRNLGLIYVPALLAVNFLSLAFIAAYRISRVGHEENLRRLAERGPKPPAAALAQDVPARSAAG